MSIDSLMILKPSIFWKYFSEITTIPRCSRNLDAISDYVLDFAKSKSLVAKKDDAGNIVIYKPGSKPGVEPILLQAHLDMVCEACPDSGKNMLFEPPVPYIDGDWVRAKDSTLGADDGVGFALILAILASDFPHPDIEALLTVDEEIGLLGAHNFDASLVKSKRMLNIDSEDEGVFTISAAGGNETTGTIPVERIDTPSKTHAYAVVLTGLQGGHSGVKIHEGRANATILFSRLFHHLNTNANISIGALNCGGIRSNVIAGHAEAIFVLNEKISAESVQVFTENIKREYVNVESNITITVKEIDPPKTVLTRESTQAIIHLIDMLPYGVINYSKQFPEVVESSVNIAQVKVADELCTVITSQRSLFEHAIDYYTEKTETAFRVLGGNVKTYARYAAWPPQEKDDLVNHLLSVYKSLFPDRSSYSEVIHAGLESGELLKKIPGLEVVSIGADLEDVHSIRERVSISSIERTWRFLRTALEQL